MIIQRCLTIIKTLNIAKKRLAKIKKESDYTLNLINRINTGDKMALREAELFAEYLSNKHN